MTRSSVAALYERRNEAQIHKIVDGHRPPLQHRARSYHFSSQLCCDQLSPFAFRR